MKKLILILPILVACKKEIIIKEQPMKTCDCYTVTEYNKYVYDKFIWSDRDSTSTYKDYCSNADLDWVYDPRGIKRWRMICK